MKKHGITLLLVAVFLATSSYGQLPLNLKAHYTFGGGSVADISGYNNHGLIIGGVVPTTDRCGNIDCAYQFPGTSTDYIEVNHSSDFNVPPTGALSISLWYYGGSISTSDFEVLFLKEDLNAAPIQSARHLALYDNNNPCFGNNWSPILMNPNPPPNPTVWHHVVGVYNNMKWYLYVDANLVDSDIINGFIISQSINNIFIGKDFDGKIDDIRFYDRELSSTEVNDIFILPCECELLGKDELKKQPAINVFPNPTSSLIYIETGISNNLIHVSVFNMNGEEIIKQFLKGQKAMIGLTTYPNGLYLVKTTSSDMIQNRIIQKHN